MSAGSLARTSSEYWQSVWQRYQRENPGAFRVEDMIDWAVDRNEVTLPQVNPKRILERQARRALREIRIRDPQGVLVRGMLPAKLPLVDSRGNLIIEVVWDHIHQMSVDHALLSFEQRDENIGKQKRSATRDLRSVLTNNPNVKGHEHQFVFDFIADEPERAAVHKISESPRKAR